MVLNRILKSGKQGYFGWTKKATWRSSVLLVTEVGRYLGDNNVLVAGFFIKSYKGKLWFVTNHTIKGHGNDQQSYRGLKQFTSPSPALFGLE